MKKLAFFLLFFVSCPIYAGFSSFDNDINYIEPTYNLFYTEVLKIKNNKDLDRNFISNIGIINLNTNTTTYIFKNDFNENIEDLFFETGFNSDSEEIKFNKNYRVENNRGIKNRLIKDKLCIYTYNSETRTYSLWFCNKLGQNLKRVKSFKRDTNWWIDIKNSKIYFIPQIADELHVDSIEW